MNSVVREIKESIECEEFKFDLNEYLEIQAKIMEELESTYGGNKIIDLNEILPDRDAFKSMYRHIYHILEEGFEIDNIRKFLVKVTFNKESGEYYELELRHLLVNMIFLRAFVELEVDVTLDSSYLFDGSQTNNKNIKKYIDEKIIKPFISDFTSDEEDFMRFNIVLHDVIYRLNKIPKDFNLLMGITLNLEDSFIKVANENPRFNEIIRTKIPETMQPKEIEDYLNALMKEEIEILKSTPNCFQPILRAGTGIKDQQLREFSISGGLKSDLMGNTIPLPINSNFVVGGLSNITNYYLDAQASRKPLIANKEKMGNSGHLALLLKLACVGTYVSKTTHDCHTPHTVALKMTSKKFVEMCAGRYYRKPGSRRFRLLKTTDKHLVGQTLLFRDPSTCSCKDGVCKTCYGALSEINKNMDIGLLASTLISRPLSQNILSTKHLNTTNSCLIAFNTEFDNFFKLEANQIKLLNDSETDLDLDKYEIYLDNIIQIDELSDSTDFNKFLQFVKVRNIKNHDEKYEIVENEGSELFIHPEFDAILKTMEKGDNNEYVIPFSRISEQILFTVNIENNELTKPLKDLDNLLKGAHFKDIHITIDKMEQKFIELMIESGIHVSGIHAATILRNLVRKADCYLERPDFNKLFVDYVVLGYPQALADNPSITTSFAYDYLKKQLTTYSTYSKHSYAPLDLLFSKRLPRRDEIAAS